eukprot:gene2898-9147_t
MALRCGAAVPAVWVAALAAATGAPREQAGQGDGSQHAPEGEGNGTAPLVAVCIVGGVRSLPLPVVYRSLHAHLIARLSTRTRVFAVLKTHDTAIPSKKPARRVTSSDEEDGWAVNPRCDVSASQYAKHGLTGRLVATNYRGRTGWCLIREYERQHRVTFDAVAKVRPDAVWVTPSPWTAADLLALSVTRVIGVRGNVRFTDTELNENSLEMHGDTMQGAPDVVFAATPGDQTSDWFVFLPRRHAAVLEWWADNYARCHGGGVWDPENALQEGQRNHTTETCKRAVGRGALPSWADAAACTRLLHSDIAPGAQAHIWHDDPCPRLRA